MISDDMVNGKDGKLVKVTLLEFNSNEFFREVVVKGGVVTKLPPPTKKEVVFDIKKDNAKVENDGK